VEGRTGIGAARYKIRKCKSKQDCYVNGNAQAGTEEIQR
jgi:hypothetical protein